MRRYAERSRVVSLLLGAALLASVFGLPATALATAPTAAPTPTSPAAGSTVSANPTLTWSAVTGGVYYHVQVSQSAAFGAAVYDVTTYQLKATPTSDLPLGTLYWRVAAQDAGGAQGPWTAAVQFTKAWVTAPTLIGPAPTTGATVNFPSTPSLFTWGPLSGAASYQIQIDDAADFATPLIDTTTKLTSYTLTTPQAYGTTYRWHVRGITPLGLYSTWSSTGTYTTAWPSTPVLTSPPNTFASTVTDLAFTWNPVAGARSYELQISPNADWENNKSLDVEVFSTRYSPSQTLLDGSYYWRVRARDAAANYGSWSLEWGFYRVWGNKPTLTGLLVGASTSDIQSVSVPTFSWTPVQRADRYQLQVGTDPNFTDGTYSDCYTNHTQFTPYVQSPCWSWVAGVVYYWHVRGIDDPSGALGKWSNSSSDDLGAFNIIPALVTQTAPTSGSTTSAPVLTWDAVNGASRYLVTIVNKDGATAVSTATYATTFTPLSALDVAKSPYSWYVQWYDNAGHLSLIPPQGTWWTFSVTAPVSTVTAPATNLLPASGSFTRMPAMSWDPVTNASFYRVYYIQAGVEHQLGGNIPYPAFTSTEATLPAGVYGWWVRAYDAGSLLLGGGPSALAAFTIAAPGVLGAGSYLTPTPKCTLGATCTPVQDTPTLTWSAYPGAGLYKVYVAVDANFSNIVKQYDTGYTTLTPIESFLDNQAGQAFYWFVRPCFALCSRFDAGVYGNASAFQKQSAAVVTAAATTSDRPVMSWTPYLTTSGSQVPAVTQEARAYHIQVATAPDFNTIIDDQTVDQTSYSPASLTYPINSTLYWRVQAIDGTGNLLTQSATRTIVRSAAVPVLSSPADASSWAIMQPLKWGAASYAASYEIEVYRNGDTKWSLVNRAIDTSTRMLAWSPNEPLAGGTYAWRVRLLDAAGRPGGWSTGRTFTITGAPALLSPATGTKRTATGLGFTWGAITGAVAYNLQLSTTSDFAATPISVVTVMNSWAPTSRPADGLWYWRVRALDANGNEIGKTSTPFKLTLDSTSPTVVITPAAAPSITGSFTATFSEPVTGISGSTFKMVVAGTTTVIGATVTPGATTATTTATLKPTSPLTPGRTYTVWVTGTIKDAAGNSVVPASITTRTALTVENGSPALKEAWQRVNKASASGAYYAQSRQAGSSQTLAVVNPGTITIYGTKTSAGGNADVYLDGVKQTATPISFYSASTQYKVAVWTKASIPAGTHTVQLKVLGTKPAASSAAWVYLDSIVAGGVTYEENNTAFVGRFATASSASASGGTYDIASRSYGDPAKPSYTMTFFGTGVDVYATKTTTSGIANVFVDGVLMTAAPGINLYAAATTYKALVYSSPTLVSKTHVVQVVVTGATASGSTRANVAIDYLVVR